MSVFLYRQTILLYLDMQILTSISEATTCCNAWRQAGQSIALVPTMGYYHQGHESLMRFAREKADKVVVSLFVNPTQFAPGEDLAAYPRDIERDSAIVKELGVDALFIPEVDAMYTAAHETIVAVPGLSRPLCGISRPTHFQGVCTVVLKLFMILCPHMAVFGEKDRQQLAIIQRMVTDLNIPVKICGRPIVREDDGLALSSRNVYLSPEERVQAPEIYKGLCMAQNLVQKGERNAARIQSSVLEMWAQTLSLGRLDYLTIVDAASLVAQDNITDNTLMACAVRMGKARLIDNVLL